MRLLHTADWHVGKGLAGRSRADEHRAVLKEIADVASEAQVDLAIVAGDIFDTFAPSPEAEAIAYQGLLDLSAAAQRVIVVGGNHDNPRRLRAVAPLLNLGRVTVLSAIRRPDDGGVVFVEAGGETARLALLPFPNQREIVRADELMDPERDSGDHSGSYDELCRGVVRELCEGAGDDTINLVVAHLMVEGGQLGGGERTSHTVMDYYVSGHAFPEYLHYVALGHVHKAQKLGAPCPQVWYSGSPLQLDFGQSSERCSVNLVEAHPGSPARVEQVPLKSGRPLRTISGALDQLVARAGEHEDAFLRILVESPDKAGLADEVRELFPNAVKIILTRPEEREQPRPELDVDRIRDAPDVLFGEYLEDAGLEDPRMVALFRELLEEVHAAD